MEEEECKKTNKRVGYLSGILVRRY